MPEHEHYICEQLSHDPSDVPKWVRKFLALRLPGIESDPKKTFGSIQEWTSLLSRPAHSIVVCAVGDGGDSTNILDREWVGILLVYGPLTRHRTAKTLEQQHRPQYDSVFFVGGLYVLPAHRKRDITSLLLEHSICVKVDESSKPKSMVPSPCDVIIQGVVTPQQK